MNQSNELNDTTKAINIRKRSKGKEKNMGINLKQLKFKFGIPPRSAVLEALRKKENVPFFMETYRDYI